VKRPVDRLIALDGVNGNALLSEAKAVLAGEKRRKGAVSHWDASGIFGEVVVAEDSAGRPSARTLLLLYAADLAFRLRWEIKPALAEGLRVVAVPYVDTAIAFGKAAGLDLAWLADTFDFAPRPGEQRIITAPAALSISDRKGFVEFGCQQMAVLHVGPPRKQLVERAARFLKAKRKVKRTVLGAGY
jgi:thymidylate kinase